MNRIWNWFAALVFDYGKYGAGQPSVHGGFEPEVPLALRQIKNH